MAGSRFKGTLGFHSCLRGGGGDCCDPCVDCEGMQSRSGRDSMGEEGKLRGGLLSAVGRNSRYFSH